MQDLTHGPQSRSRANSAAGHGGRRWECCAARGRSCLSTLSQRPFGRCHLQVKTNTCQRQPHAPQERWESYSYLTIVPYRNGNHRSSKTHTGRVGVFTFSIFSSMLETQPKFSLCHMFHIGSVLGPPPHSCITILEAMRGHTASTAMRGKV